MTEPAEPSIRGVDFILLDVEDLDRARAFYADVVGLEPGPVWGGGDSGHPIMGAEFETGTVTIALFDVAKVGREFSPSPTAIALRVDDVQAERERLEAHGVQFQMDEIIDSGVCHQLYFNDSEGNTLGLHHRYAPHQKETGT